MNKSFLLLFFKKEVLSSFALVFIVGIFPARADSACDKPRNDFDGLYCLSKVYQQADQDLNENFAKLRKRLDNPGRELLRNGQLAWLETRDKQCSRHDPDGFYVNLSCATKVTIARTQFLEDRYRECVSSGCRNSRISTSE